MAITSLRRIRAKTVRSAVASVALGERLPNAAYVATGALLLFKASFNLDKYYGFAAQILYHFVLSGCFATAIYTSDNTLYHLATLAEPAYCTFDILLLLFTGVSFTHWQLKPLLVHHTISCACCMVELNAAAIGSFAFVVIKTPIITRALQEAIQESLGKGRRVTRTMQRTFPYAGYSLALLPQL
eukprot:g29674.t1